MRDDEEKFGIYLFFLYLFIFFRAKMGEGSFDEISLMQCMHDHERDPLVFR